MSEAGKPQAWAARADRFAPLDAERLSEEQQAVVDRILASPRGGMRGPFPVWLQSPDLAGRLIDVGDYVRFGNSLTPALKEMVILLTARAWSADFEWWAHRPLALKAGLSARIVDCLEHDRRPDDMSDAEAAIYDFVTELYSTKRVADGTFERMKRHLGSQGIVDVIATTGYYCIVSMTLNVADVQPLDA